MVANFEWNKDKLFSTVAEFFITFVSSKWSKLIIKYLIILIVKDKLISSFEMTSLVEKLGTR